jgi:predicted CopG family antitoxin
MKTVTVSMPEEYYEIVHGLAEQAGVSFSYVIRDLICDKRDDIIEATLALEKRGMVLGVKRKHGREK